MDLGSLTARIIAQEPAGEEQARAIAIDLTAASSTAPFAGALRGGSFHAALAQSLGEPAHAAAVRSVKLPFTVVFQRSFKPFP